MKQKLKKSLVVGIIVLFIGIEIVPSVNPTDIIWQHGTIEELVTKELSTNVTYYNVDILIISHLYIATSIDGFHDSHFGFGHDEKIVLNDVLYCPVGVFIIWNSSEIKELNLYGGWANSIVEIFGYDGWMSGHNSLITSLKTFGYCEKIKLSFYRGY